MPAASNFVAGLKSPISLAFDASNNLYVVERNAPGIAKITTARVKSGVGTSGGRSASGVAVDAAGNVFTCFADSPQIFKNNVFWATDTLIQDAQDIAVDSTGNVYVACAGTNCIVKISAT